MAPHGGVEVDGAMVARALGLPVPEFRQRMRDGHVRTLCERGTGADAGRFRLSFYLGKRRVRIVTDAHGRVLERSVRDG